MHHCFVQIISFMQLDENVLILKKTTKMGCIDINECVHTRNGFVDVVVAVAPFKWAFYTGASNGVQNKLLIVTGYFFVTFGYTVLLSITLVHRKSENVVVKLLHREGTSKNSDNCDLLKVSDF